MPKISIDHSSQVGGEQALKKIQEFFETDADIKRMDPKIQCRFDAAKLAGEVKGSQMSAQIRVENKGTGSLVNVAVDLPFLLTPLKGKIEEMVRKKLAKFLA